MAPRLWLPGSLRRQPDSADSSDSAGQAVTCSAGSIWT